MAEDVARLLAAGRAALDDWDWAAARDAFTAAAEVDESPEATDGLGQALYWLHDYPAALAHRERAHALYRGRGDLRDAARVAVQLAQWYGLIHGHAATVNGWLGHARRSVDAAGDCPERGWVELFRGCICHDPREREHRSRAAADLGRRFGIPALEFDALGYLGKARVEQGAVDEGMGLIDEAVAAASSGLVGDAWATGEIYCTLFHACEITVDVRRAEAWLDTVDGYVDRTGELPISGICRVHYGGLLTSAGRFPQAERELTAALAIYEQGYRGTRLEPLRRLADLRLRQGRPEEAERLLAGFEDHAAVATVQARLLLTRGQAEVAAAVLDRATPGSPPGLADVEELALGVEVALAVGRPDLADDRTGRLEDLARRTGVPSVRGFAARSRARVAAARAGDAVAPYERALVAFAEADLVQEVAVTRLELARQLRSRSPAVAEAEARRAWAAFRALDDARGADTAAGVLRELGVRVPVGGSTGGELTARQQEVLDLLAEGLSNAQIAERLYISPRTAEHHVSNILAALGLPSRAAAAAHALRRDPTG